MYLTRELVPSDVYNKGQGAAAAPERQRQGMKYMCVAHWLSYGAKSYITGASY